MSIKLLLLGAFYFRARGTCALCIDESTYSFWPLVPRSDDSCRPVPACINKDKNFENLLWV